MKSHYVEAEAARFQQQLVSPPPGSDAARPISQILADRTYTARLLGQETALVLHGGGNTSAKGTEKDIFGESVEVLYIKGSGSDLATIEPKGHPTVRLDRLRKLRALPALSDEQMVNELRLALLDAHAPNPSVETLLHAWLPARFVDHTHADAVLAIADQPDGERICSQIYGRGLVWVPYVMPGFELAKRCSDAFDAVVRRGEKPAVIILEKHGIFTFGETARESYEAMIAAVGRAERYVTEARRTSTSTGPSPSPAPEASKLLPRLRGALARAAEEPAESGPILSLRTSDAILAFLERPDARALVATGCVTPDHVIRTKPEALFIARAQGDHADLEAFSTRAHQEILQYARNYDAYFERMCADKGVRRTKLDPWPRVILLPGVGICTVGRSRKEAEVAADVYEHTVQVMADAADIGRYEPVGRADLFDMEYWSLEQAKLGGAKARGALAGKIAVVTGAASGIGEATAARFLALGAHVALLDRDAALLAEVHAALGRAHGSASVFSAACDVTRWAEVAAAFEKVVTRFGGVDVLVSNAGNAPEGRLDEARGEEALRASLEVNLLAHNHTARAASDIMRAQGTGGALLFNASKAAFNPGAGFGPYAVAKSALVGLMRQYAVDSGSLGIRANAVNADRVRTRLFGGGLAESRAKNRGVSVEEYFRMNLLGREVTGADVADAFAYLAQAPTTTGCIITVDGGNSAAFPR